MAPLPQPPVCSSSQLSSLPHLCRPLVIGDPPLKGMLKGREDRWPRRHQRPHRGTPHLLQLASGPPGSQDYRRPSREAAPRLPSLTAMPRDAQGQIRGLSHPPQASCPAPQVGDSKITQIKFNKQQSTLHPKKGSYY
ncbi:hypothetical protein NDU88_004545 [Pleurodeles waltl]|uniref:Uncharacterized protein n=1 Tax=Pleurodeles waltl TaxID=8319 RepID=A0AAV7NU17_PLEWA|nr:hypothetical protein NDU88_004545 [Pleurodeles waltl]